MRKVHLDQGSNEWLEWRKGKITATDAATLLGCNPYVTPFKCWQRKTGEAEEQAVTPAMLRGHIDEPIARKMFIDESAINMTPCCIESEKYLFLGASLDGLSDCGRYLLEIKSQPIDKIIPEYHICQMQHQMLCSDSKIEMGFYVSIWDGKIDIKEVYPDNDWVEDYIPQAKEFWKRIIFLDPPPLSQKDYKNMEGCSEWYLYAKEYRLLSQDIKKLEAIKDMYKKKLINLCGEENGYGGGIKVMKKTTKGRVDYADLIESLNVEDEIIKKFRSQPTTSWAVTIDR